MAVASGDRAEAKCVRLYGPECVYRLGGERKLCLLCDGLSLSDMGDG